MNEKKIVLGTLAFAFGLGSAFTSAYTPTTAFIKVRYSYQPPGSFSCVNTNFSCNNAGSVACKVMVTDLVQHALARGNRSCPTPNLFTSSTGPVSMYNDPLQIVEVSNN
jgi:hypothetical protein